MLQPKQRMSGEAFIPKHCSAHSSPQGSQCPIQASDLRPQQTSTLCQLFGLGQPRHPRTPIRNSKHKTASQKGRIWEFSEALTAVDRWKHTVPLLKAKIIFRPSLTFFSPHRCWRSDSRLSEMASLIWIPGSLQGRTLVSALLFFFWLLDKPRRFRRALRAWQKDRPTAR